MDSVNLKDPKLGIYDQIVALVKAQGVASGRVRLELAGGERQAGLTVNEYETLLMRHDLADVLRNPVPLRGGEGAPHVGVRRARFPPRRSTTPSTTWSAR